MALHAQDREQYNQIVFIIQIFIQRHLNLSVQFLDT